MSEVRAILARRLSEHQPAGWSGAKRKPYKCRCGVRYAAPISEHQVGVLSSLLRDLVTCHDCVGVGNDLCDVCDGSGQRGRGKCSNCKGSGFIDCPTCDALGLVSRCEAERIGWSVPEDQS